MKKVYKLGIVLSLFLCLFSIQININGASSRYNPEYATANIPTNYYADLDLSLRGEAFRKDLSEIISEGYVQYPYKSNGKDVHEILLESDINSNGEVVCIYSGATLPDAQRGGEIEWDKEHVWAKSHGFPTSGYEDSEPYSDIHNLRACTSTINTNRSDKDMGIVENPIKTFDGGSRMDNGVFEPRDEVKGDVARMMFYMATRYGFNEFALALVDDRVTERSALNGRFGNLQTLLQWHNDDPVSTEEIYRNNVIYQYQKNRNPYIDHPEYVNLAYSEESLEPDLTAVNNVIKQIQQLPVDISIAHEEAVNTVNDLYKSLNTASKNLVVNYNVLDSAVKKIDLLKAENEKLSYGFTFGDSVFGSNKDLTQNLGSIPWTLSYVKAGEGIYFGSNDKGQQFGSANNSFSSMSLTTNSITGNVSKIVVNASGADDIKGTITVSVGSTNSSSYTLTTTATNYEFIFNSNSGAISIALSQTSKKAFYIKSIEVYTSTDVTVDEYFEIENTKASLAVEYTDSNPTKVDLRFGGIISDESYDENAKYGIIVLQNTEENYELLNDKENFDLSKLDTNYYINCNLVKVAEGYQFAWVINNIDADNYDFEFIAVMFMEIDGEVYLSKCTTHSVISVRNYYVNYAALDENIISVLNNIESGK